MAKLLGIGLGVGAAVYGYRYFVDIGKRLTEDQHVVIVGGGYGGARLANKLKGRGSFTLIDQRDALHHNMAALRAAVEPGFAKKTFIFYEPTFGANFLQGKVVDIDTTNKQVSLEEGKEPINYTQLVLATGSSGPFPGKCRLDMSTQSLMKMYNDFTDEIKQAKNIVIVGGGAVGVEMAGEIIGDYPEGKKMTIVHNGDTLVSSLLEPEARTKIQEKLKERKIEVMYGETVSNLADIPVLKTSDNIVVKTSSGKEIVADLVIPCYGLKINTDAYKSSLADSMNARGQLKVDKNLQVVGTEDIFAIGDCSDTDVCKLALQAQAQADQMYENLINIAKGKPLEPFVPGTFRMVVPIGRDGGVAQNGKKVFGDFLAKMIKAKDVFVKIIWKEMSQPVPKDK
uniref:Ferroptosis suppressor protein 1 n=1 Tax=Phallusia mammillata TaxID=59560 RepID=A0A6F9D6L8_9ASCI|nr:apoptosis-inducing factor 2 [Phallusia mammillata]